MDKLIGVEGTLVGPCNLRLVVPRVPHFFVPVGRPTAASLVLLVVRYVRRERTFFLTFSDHVP